MLRARAYEALTAVLQNWLDLPLADLLARLNQVSVDTVWRDGRPIEVEVCALEGRPTAGGGAAWQRLQRTPHAPVARIDEHIEIPVAAPNCANPGACQA